MKLTNSYQNVDIINYFQIKLSTGEKYTVEMDSAEPSHSELHNNNY